MSIDIKKLIEEQFMNDELKRVIEFNNELANQLYPNFIYELNPEETYSTVEVSVFLGRHDSTLRNYLRNENLVKYIKPTKVGRLIRLNYKSIFRLHMILLYLQGGKVVSDVEVLLGYRSEVLDYDIHKSSTVQKNQSRIDPLVLKKYLEITNDKLMLMEYENKIRGQKGEIENKESALKIKEMQYELLETNIRNYSLEKRHQQFLTSALKKALPQKKGFFFKKQQIDIELMINEVAAANQLNDEDFDSKLQEQKNQLPALKKEIAQLKEDVQILKDNLNEEQKKLKNQLKIDDQQDLMKNKELLNKLLDSFD